MTHRGEDPGGRAVPRTGTISSAARMTMHLYILDIYTHSTQHIDLYYYVFINYERD